MIVCLCRGVSDRKVRLAVASGAQTLKEVAMACGAGRGCGSCHAVIEQMIEDPACRDCHAQSVPLPFPSAARATAG